MSGLCLSSHYSSSGLAVELFMPCMLMVAMLWLARCLICGFELCWMVFVIFVGGSFLGRVGQFEDPVVVTFPVSSLSL